MVAPFTKIVVDKVEERKFRRRAMAKYPKEYMEAMWGYIRGDVLYICVFMPVSHKGKRGECKYEHSELDHHEEEASEHKLTFIGTIHSHPCRDEGIFSEGDLRDLQETQEIAFGICAIQKSRKGTRRKRCMLEYWPRVTPLKVERKDWR